MSSLAERDDRLGDFARSKQLLVYKQVSDPRAGPTGLSSIN